MVQMVGRNDGIPSGCVFFFFPLKYIARSLTESAGSGIIGAPEKRQEGGKELR